MTYVPEAMDGVRRYGPGKFDTVLDSHIYNLTLDTSWLDDDMGDAQWLWAGRIDGPIALADFRDAESLSPEETLTDDETRLLKATAGYILTENCQGFVGVEYYETLAELESDWQDLRENACEVAP